MKKQCHKCKQEKDLGDFSKNSRRKDGLELNCRACISIFHKEQYQKHKKYYNDKSKKQHYDAKRNKRERNYTVKGRFNYAKSRATHSKKGWYLSFDEYKNLVTQPCHYCFNDLAPPRTCGVGLDRIDNTKGYQLDNVLPCCGVCNSIRNDYLSVKETELAVQAVVLFRMASNTEAPRSEQKGHSQPPSVSDHPI